MNTPVINLIEGAIQQHQTGNLESAAASYKAILEKQSENIDALFLLGTLHLQQHDIETACQLLRNVLALKPDHAMAYNNLGTALQELGQLEKAEECYHRACLLIPEDPKVRSNLGDIYREQGKFGNAVISYRYAMRYNPDSAELHCNLGAVFHKMGRMDDAIFCYRSALDLKPDYALAHSNLGMAFQESGLLNEALKSSLKAKQLEPDNEVLQNNLGTVLKRLGRFDEAEECYRNAITLKPDYAEAHNNLGTVFLEKKELHKAVASYNLAIELKPDYAMAYSNLGTVWRELGKLDTSIESCNRAIEVSPDYAEAHNNLGTSLQETGSLDEAIKSYKKAISLKSDYALAHMNNSLALLLAGNFKDGWQEYEWRLQIREHIPKTLGKPLWDGLPLNGRSILIHVEQGFGDTIQFARYLPMVKERGGRVILECQKELIRLLSGCSGIDEFVEYVPTCKPSVPFDVHISLLSLPGIYGTTLETVPADIPYIKVDAALRMKWGMRLGRNNNLRIGIAWSGNPRNANDRNRSCSLQDFAILRDIPNITFYTLQKGAAAAEASTIPEGMDIVNLERELRDFVDTAAVIANLDLVISIDTVIVHLAGAMGKPVWNLLPFAPAWRWLQDRDGSPWYPTMRLFRHSHPKDWLGVFRQVRRRLHGLL
ncbi:MAG: tetratricopeptide repeat protein [Candidatus Scalindua sp.]|nr:tetratricopeptide repeat protein [Candidatus Scalindua sp.]